MTDENIALTDPARELADLLTLLQGGNIQTQGDRYLAAAFGVAPWSQDFYRIIATIMDRLSDLKGIVAELPIDDDFRGEMVGHVNEIANAFSPNGFNNIWANFGWKQLSAQNVQPLKGLSGLVRQRIAYRKLSDNDLTGLTATIQELINWLGERQLTERDFIRQALLDGLHQLEFRLSKFRWLGWGYTLDSLREVVGAYMLLERQPSNPADNPDIEAMLAKVGAAIKAVYEKIEVVKKASETGDWLLKIYGAAHLAQHALPTIKALLPAS